MEEFMRFMWMAVGFFLGWQIWNVVSLVRQAFFEHPRLWTVNEYLLIFVWIVAAIALLSHLIY